MDRFLMNKLVEWKKSPRRKPLILNGARQVGKTWLLKTFGEAHFDNVAYVNFDNDETAKAFFEHDLDVDRIISNLALHTGVDIAPQNTLIILDEIQEAPKALTALKYFCENAPEFAVASAGSLLGLATHEGSGYPVGKVDTLDLYPMKFREFLDATKNQMLRETLDSDDFVSISAFKQKATDLLKTYYVVGGMPEVVNAHALGANFENVRKIQESIVEGYKRDFAKHAPARLFPKMLETWESIPSHLSQENKKFVFGHIRKGARAKDYEEVLTWFSNAGLICKVPRVTKPALPLSAYNDNKCFKVFLSDVGLLGAMSGLQPSAIVDGNTVFTEFKGALTEQFVCQQLMSDIQVQPFYWSAENSTGEIDFLIKRGSEIYAIEVKAEENLRSKSLRAFKEKYDKVNAIRFSLSDYRRQGWMTNIPLYAMTNSSMLAMNAIESPNS